MADGDDPIPLADEPESVPEDDGDELDLPRPARPPAPVQPLPRIWKVDPEPEDEDEPRRKSRKERLAEEKEQRAGEKSRAAAKSSRKSRDGEKPKGVLLEETPESETYEARRRTRMVIGGALLAAVGLGIYVLFKSLGGGQPPPPPPVDEGQIVAGPAANLDQEAKILLGNARDLARTGNTKGAIVALEKIVKTYPKTATAAEAREALGRPSRNLPLFVDPATVVASAAAPSPKAVGPPAPVVEVGTAPPAVKAGGPGDARIDLMPNAPEPGRAAHGAPTATISQVAAARPVPPGFRARTEAGVHASGWPNQVVSDRDGATMVLIPAGTYLQGRDDGAPEEAPEHKVALAAYYIDQHEVTARQFNLYLKETGGKPAAPKAPAKGESNPSGDGDDLPVVNVSAREALAYCDWAGKRLPTEAQWEAAGRTTDGRLYPWGANSPVWSRPRVPRQIDPVMAFALDQSPYGAFDLAGNAWEYTKDYYDSRYYQQFRGKVAENPTGPTSSRSRPPQVVVKGTSKSWLLSAREGLKADGHFPYVGFRGVLNVEATTSPDAAAPGGAPAGNRPTTPGGIVPF